VNSLPDTTYSCLRLRHLGRLRRLEIGEYSGRNVECNTESASQKRIELQLPDQNLADTPSKEASGFPQVGGAAFR
jgi:hypothetical protein